jgi:hypothetical protein
MFLFALTSVQQGTCDSSSFLTLEWYLNQLKKIIQPGKKFINIRHGCFAFYAGHANGNECYACGRDDCCEPMGWLAK